MLPKIGALFFRGVQRVELTAVLKHEFLCVNRNEFPLCSGSVPRTLSKEELRAEQAQEFIGGPDFP